MSHTTTAFLPKASDCRPAGRRARLIAFYLPQFHPIPENDRWWGAGFTEWTNVAKARPLYRGHYQPHIPADLGFYDLRLPETRIAQAELARSAGIEAFCYWHYWFAGRRLLERPFAEVLNFGEPDFPFCLGWANQSWTGVWHGAPDRVLIEQTYPGPADDERHFYAIVAAFHDRRYVRVDDKPLFLVYRPSELPKPAEFIERWQTLARKNGLPGIHFVAHAWFNDRTDYRRLAFDGTVFQELFSASSHSAWHRAWRLNRHADGNPLTAIARSPASLAHAVCLKALKHVNSQLRRPTVITYAEAMLYFLDAATSHQDAYPCVVPNWDNSPRSGRNALILHESTPELFQRHLHAALDLVRVKSYEHRLVFLKSWNEWAEGNHLEPDLRFGHSYLNVLRREVIQVAQTAFPRAE